MGNSKRNIVLICHNLRSCHNVGSLLRTADGLGVDEVYLTGYTPYPTLDNDPRLAHIASKMHKQIHKTALGAEDTVNWKQSQDIFGVLDILKSRGYIVAALEQTKNSIELPSWIVPNKLTIVVGRETYGLEEDVIAACKLALEIPMYGKKESFNVVQAAAMALYHARFH